MSFYATSRQQYLSTLTTFQEEDPTKFVTDNLVGDFLKESAAVQKFNNITPYYTESENKIRYLRDGESFLRKLYNKFGTPSSTFLTENSAVITIPEWSSFDGVTTDDGCEVLVFNEDGILINPDKQSLIFCHSGVMSIFIKHCICYGTGTLPVHCGKVNVVIINTNGQRYFPKDGYSPAILEATSEYSRDCRVIEATENVPSQMFVAYENKNAKWMSYPINFYSMYVMVGLLDPITEADITDVEDEAKKLLIMQQVNEKITTRQHYFFPISESKYTISRAEARGSNIIFNFAGTNIVEELDINIKIQTHVNIEGELYTYNYVVRKLPKNSAFRVQNCAAPFADDFFITKVADKKYTLEHRTELEYSNLVFNPKVGALNFIPLCFYEGSIDNKDEYDVSFNTSWTHAIPLSHKIKEEDVLLFINGVKMTPYVDYSITPNTDGNETGSPSIQFVLNDIFIDDEDDEIETVDPDASTRIASTFPVPAAGHPVWIKVIVCNPRSNMATYIGPKGKEDEDRDILEINEGEEYYPVLKQTIEAGSTALPLSVLPYSSILVFQAGRYLPLESNYKDRVILDRYIDASGLETIKDVELHTIFDQSRYASIAALADRMYDEHLSFDAMLEKLANLHSDTAADVLKYIKAWYGNDTEVRINIDDSDDVPSAKDILLTDDVNLTSPIEAYLNGNTILAYCEDEEHSETEAEKRYVRYPTITAELDANEDLSKFGYKGDIVVSGNRTPGLADDTETFSNPHLFDGK